MGILFNNLQNKALISFTSLHSASDTMELFITYSYICLRERCVQCSIYWRLCTYTCTNLRQKVFLHNSYIGGKCNEYLHAIQLQWLVRNIFWNSLHWDKEFGAEKFLKKKSLTFTGCAVKIKSETAFWKMFFFYNDFY